MSLDNRIAGAPISWGVCEVPGWGYQLPADKVLSEMSSLGLAATELGPDGFLPTDTDQLAGGSLTFTYLINGVTRTSTIKATLGNTTAPYQHHAHLVMRAIENRLPVARAAITGISGYIDPLGRTRAATGRAGGAWC